MQGVLIVLKNPHSDVRRRIDMTLGDISLTYQLEEIRMGLVFRSDWMKTLDINTHTYRATGGYRKHNVVFPCPISY